MSSIEEKGLHRDVIDHVRLCVSVLRCFVVNLSATATKPQHTKTNTANHVTPKEDEKQVPQVPDARDNSSSSLLPIISQSCFLPPFTPASGVETATFAMGFDSGVTLIR